VAVLHRSSLKPMVANELNIFLEPSRLTAKKEVSTSVFDLKGGRDFEY
jgi:hypothetical protein